MAFAAIAELYSKSTKEFYWRKIHENTAPSDAIKIAGDENGNLILIDKSASKTVLLIERAIQSKLDEGARAWGYFDIVTAISYISSTNSQYVADAQTLIAWRDSVWAWAIPLLNNIQGGEDIITFLQSMPAQPQQPS